MDKYEVRNTTQQIFVVDNKVLRPGDTRLVWLTPDMVTYFKGAGVQLSIIESKPVSDVRTVKRGTSK